jgi:hypothetical protein
VAGSGRRLTDALGVAWLRLGAVSGGCARSGVAPPRGRRAADALGKAWRVAARVASPRWWTAARSGVASPRGSGPRPRALPRTSPRRALGRWWSGEVSPRSCRVGKMRAWEPALVTGRARGALAGERPAAARGFGAWGLGMWGVPCSEVVQHAGEIARGRFEVSVILQNPDLLTYPPDNLSGFGLPRTRIPIKSITYRRPRSRNRTGLGPHPPPCPRRRTLWALCQEVWNPCCWQRMSPTIGREVPWHSTQGCTRAVLVWTYLLCAAPVGECRARGTRAEGVISGRPDLTDRSHVGGPTWAAAISIASWHIGSSASVSLVEATASTSDPASSGAMMAKQAACRREWRSARAVTAICYRAALR